jgi:hypothetical protein
VRSGSYDSRPRVKMTMSTAATAITPVAIQSAAPLGMNSPPNPRGETVVLKDTLG